VYNTNTYLQTAFFMTMKSSLDEQEEEMDLPHAEDSLIAKHCCDCKLSKCKVSFQTR